MNILFLENFPINKIKDCGSKYIYFILKMLSELNINIDFVNSFDINNINLPNINIIKNINHYNNYNHYNYNYCIISRKNSFTIHKEIIDKLKCPIFYINHDLEFKRKEKEFIENNDYKKYNKKLVKSLKKEEFELINKCSKTLIISLDEINYLKNHIQQDKLLYFPLYYQNNEIDRKVLKKTHNIVFIGSQHKPNIDGIKYFLDNYFNEILKIKDIKLILVGQVCFYIDNYKKIIPKNLELKGYVSDEELKKIMRGTRINLIPLTYGAGLKGKMVDALNYGIPIISTPIGVEGTNIQHEKEAIIMDFKNYTPQEYAQTFIKYYENRNLLRNIIKNGKEYFLNNFEYNIGKEKIKNLLN